MRCVGSSGLTHLARASVWTGGAGCETVCLSRSASNALASGLSTAGVWCPVGQCSAREGWFGAAGDCDADHHVGGEAWYAGDLCWRSSPISGRTNARLTCSASPYIICAALKAEGIFRLSGSANEIGEYKRRYDLGTTSESCAPVHAHTHGYLLPSRLCASQYFCSAHSGIGETVSFEHEQDPHNVAGLLKLYFREMPEPIATWDMFFHFIIADCTLLLCPVVLCRTELSCSASAWHGNMD